jgi:hypothetical protein
MSRSKTAVWIVGLLLLGAGFGSVGTKYFVQKKQRWEMAVTFSEITILTIEQLRLPSKPMPEEAQKCLIRALVLCAQGSKKLMNKNDDAADIAKKTLKLIEPYTSNPIYIQENLEPQLPFDQERNFFR